MGAEELFERTVVQQSLGLLIEEGLVARTATFGNEQEFVFVAFGCIEIDLCRQVGAGILLVGHGEGDDLRVAQVALLVGLVHAARDALCIIDTRIDILALFADADGRTGILAGREFAFGRNDLVQQHRVGDEFVVVGSLGIVEDLAEFLQMGGAQVEGDIVVGLLGQQFESFRVDFQDAASVALDDLDIVFGQQSILRIVPFDRERFLIDEFRHDCEYFILN